MFSSAVDVYYTSFESRFWHLWHLAPSSVLGLLLTLLAVIPARPLTPIPLGRKILHREADDGFSARRSHVSEKYLAWSSICGFKSRKPLFSALCILLSIPFVCLWFIIMARCKKEQRVQRPRQWYAKQREEHAKRGRTLRNHAENTKCALASVVQKVQR